ncbi:hypothetical protein [Streptomyces sirii]
MANTSGASPPESAVSDTEGGEGVPAGHRSGWSWRADWSVRRC